MKTSLQRVNGSSLLAAAILLSAAALPTFAATSTVHTHPSTNHRYQADYTNRNWTGAINACKAKGAHLVTLSNGDDLSMINDVILENPSLNYTIGTYISKVTGTIETITGEYAHLPFGYMLS